MVPPPVLTVEPDYRIGVGDVLEIRVWREETASGDVVVRPDGKVTPKMLGDIFVLGLTTDDVKKLVEEGLKPSFTDGVPEVQIAVKAINSRIVYITGAVNKPGQYPLIGPMNINQLITTAGGLVEFADKKKILLDPRLAEGQERSTSHALHQLRGSDEGQERAAEQSRTDARRSGDREWGLA